MISKGRKVNGPGNPESLPHHRGEDHGAAKLTSEQVIQIREMYASGKYFQKAIGALFGIQQSAVNKIVTRRSWAHL
jgi:predicted XRE-type DNA-binding protein